MERIERIEKDKLVYETKIALSRYVDWLNNNLTQSIDITVLKIRLYFETPRQFISKLLWMLNLVV